MPDAQADPIGGVSTYVPAAAGYSSLGGGYQSGAGGYEAGLGAYGKYGGLAQPRSASTMQVGSVAPSSPTGPGPYEALIQQAAARNGIDPALLKGLIEQESGFDPNAHSSAGALGLTQLMPSTAASLGVRNPLDPTEAVEGGARLLGELLRQFGGNVSDALAAYNAGAGAVERYGGVPPYPETEAYVSKVLANAQSYHQHA